MVSIRSVSTSLPDNKYSTEELHQLTRAWREVKGDDRGKFDRLLDSSKIKQRHFSIPIDQIFSLNGMQRRAELFQELGTPLVKDVVTKALEKEGIGYADVETLIVTSCTSPVIPALDTMVLNELPFKPTIRRIPLYQHGCAGGAVGLNLGHSFSNTLIVSVELCSLVFQPEDLRGSSLVGSALFADGAAATFVSNREDGLVFLDTRSFLIPNSRHLMGYEILDDGVHLKLDRELPQYLAEFAPTVIENFFRENGLSSADVKWWLLHPGGVRILEILQKTFNLSREQTLSSWNVLSDFGNMSSATILFVLCDFLSHTPFKKGDHIFMMGVGPGLTLELLLFRAGSDGPI